VSGANAANAARQNMPRPSAMSVPRSLPVVLPVHARHATAAFLLFARCSRLPTSGSTATVAVTCPPRLMSPAACPRAAVFMLRRVWEVPALSAVAQRVPRLYSLPLPAYQEVEAAEETGMG